MTEAERAGGRRWRLGHVVAAVELACAVVVTAYLVLLGIDAERSGTAGRSALDRALPFLVAVVLGGGLTLMAWRSRRTADDQPPPPRRQAPGPVPAATPYAAPRPVPELSDDGRREVARVVAVLAGAGVLAPETPDPDDLAEAAADHGEPFTADVVLTAMGEAQHYRPGFEPERYTANLALHHSHVEQALDHLYLQGEDVVRLCGADASEVSVDLELEEDHAARFVRTRLRVGVGDVVQVHDYFGAHKELSTYLHVVLARLLRAPGRPRLAWLWSDQGAWLTGLADGTLDGLNANLGAAAADRWVWVDEDAPFAAGDR